MVDMETDAQDTSPGRRRFRICVAGRLDARFTDGAAGIELGQATDGSTLEGPFIDQSQMRGILDQLWQLGVEVLRFETYVPAPTANETSVPPPAAERHPDSPRPTQGRGDGRPPSQG